MGEFTELLCKNREFDGAVRRACGGKRDDELSVIVIPARIVIHRDEFNFVVRLEFMQAFIERIVALRQHVDYEKPTRTASTSMNGLGLESGVEERIAIAPANLDAQGRFLG